MKKANSKSSSKKVLRMLGIMLLWVGYMATMAIPFAIMLIFDREAK